MEWEIYPTPVQGKLGLMLVDLQYQTQGSPSSWRYLNWFRTSFPADTNGFPKSESLAVLEEISNWLTKQYEGSGAVVGRLTVDGRREFFVYAERADANDLEIEAAMTFPGQRFEARSSEDSSWELYREFLCPDPVQMQRLASHKAMQVLQDRGDIVSAPRTVSHVAVFLSEEAREEFAAYVTEMGFRIVGEEDIEDPAAIRPFVLRYEEEHAVDVIGLERNVMPFFQKARESGGEYGGWQCAPVTGDA